MANGTVREGTVKAWDLPTRLFHWTLVASILSAWISFTYANQLGDPQLKWHRWNGMFICVLVVWRVLWGFVGGSTSRWSAFFPWPWKTLPYLRDVITGKERHFLGHNPLGAVMIVALLLVVGAQATLGLYTLEHNELAAGPLQRTILENESLNKTIQWLHRNGFYVILGLACVHITANALSMKGLIPAMITGRKKADDYEDQREAKGGSVALAALLLVISAGIVYGTIVAMGGRIVFFA